MRRSWSASLKSGRKKSRPLEVLDRGIAGPIAFTGIQMIDFKRTSRSIIIDLEGHTTQEYTQLMMSKLAFTK